MPSVQAEPLVEFPSGARRSDRTGKGRYDLIPPFPLLQLALVYEEGGAQKGDRNWEHGFPISRAFDSALRHIQQDMMDLRDERHLAQAVWQLFAIMEFRRRIAAGTLPPELDDMPRHPSDPSDPIRVHPRSSVVNPPGVSQ